MLKDQIIQLRTEGLSYSQIAKQLAISNGTIAYHVGPTQKEKTLQRQRKLQEKIKAQKPPKEKKPKPIKVKVIKIKKVRMGNKPKPEKAPVNRRDTVFKTKAVDYSKLIKIRLDEKTEVYVKPGYNITALKAKYTPNAK